MMDAFEEARLLLSLTETLLMAEKVNFKRNIILLTEIFPKDKELSVVLNHLKNSPAEGHLYTMLSTAIDKFKAIQKLYEWEQYTHYLSFA